MDLSKLKEPFGKDEVEWRVQQLGKNNGKCWALLVPYIQNRAIQNRLDEVCGPENWKNDFMPGPDGGVLCGISIKIKNEWITKWDGAENTDIEPVKGGLSDSMKRAAVQWGMGRYLYELDPMFVAVVEKKPDTRHIRINDKKKGIYGYAIMPDITRLVLPKENQQSEEKPKPDKNPSPAEISKKIYACKNLEELQAYWNNHFHEWEKTLTKRQMTAITKAKDKMKDKLSK